MSQTSLDRGDKIWKWMKLRVILFGIPDSSQMENFIQCSVENILNLTHWRPEKYDRQFADILKWIFVNGKYRILIKIPL